MLGNRKAWAFTAAALALAPIVSVGGAEPDRPVFSRLQINLKFQESPRVKTSGGQSSGGKLALVNKRWGVIEIEYTPYLRSGRAAEKSRSRSGAVTEKSRRVSGAWLDDVTLGVQVIMVDPQRSGRRRVGYALLSGRCEFWSISLDARAHRAYMFIPPQLLDRFMPTKRTDGLDAKAAVSGDFRIQVIFFNRVFGVVGEAFYGLSARRLSDQREEFADLRKTVGSRNILHGALLTRVRTPWGLGDMDQYDLVKPDVIAAPLDDAAIEKAAAEAEARESGESKSKSDTPTVAPKSETPVGASGRTPRTLSRKSKK